MTVRLKLREVAEAASFDPKAALYEALGDISGIEVLHDLVLVATYIEPATTPGGIIKPDQTLAENRFQGKGALILAMGPTAFKYSDAFVYEGVKPQVGDWVLVRPSDGMELFKVDATGTAGTSCRLFSASRIMCRLRDPALIY